MTPRKERITVSLPAELAEQARRAVAAGEASDVSAYVAACLAAKAGKATSRQVLDRLFADIGTPGPDHDTWARRSLGLDGSTAGAAAA
jgi:hypothetical protein